MKGMGLYEQEGLLGQIWSFFVEPGTSQEGPWG